MPVWNEEHCLPKGPFANGHTNNLLGNFYRTFFAHARMSATSGVEHGRGLTVHSYLRWDVSKNVGFLILL